MEGVSRKIKPVKISLGETYAGKYVDSIMKKTKKRKVRISPRVSIKRKEIKNPLISLSSILKIFSFINFALGELFGIVGRAFRKTLFIWKFSLVALVLVSVVPLSAFEAHIVDVTAVLLNIDPPVIAPPGGQYTGPVDIIIDDGDPDATYIFYTITPGTDPTLAPDPACGVLPGGPKSIGPITLSDDSVVKAIACDGPDGSAHHSLITTEIYDLTLKGRIEGRKYNDLDRSEGLSTGDTPVEGWQVTLKQGTSTIATTVTDVGGYYSFVDLDPGTYEVVEESRAGWQATAPATVSLTVNSNETKTANFFNFDTGFACLPTSINFPSHLAVQAAGTTSGNDDVVLASNVTINGDVRSNDEIEVSGGGSNRHINGDAGVVNTIDPGIVISGATSTGLSAVSLPDAGIATWKARAQQGGTVNGSFTFPNNTTGLVMGPTEIMGSLTLGSSNGLTVRGPIYIHGNLTIGSNTTINQDPAFGNQFTTIIVDGTVNISSNITFVGAGTTGTFLLISTHAAVAGDGATIETNSNNSDLGDVVLYASNGDIHIRSNRTLLAAFATHGTGTDTDPNGAVLLDSNVTVNYRTLPNQVSCGPRQPYESTSHVLINEFMPNPAGSDQGAAGAPLDGEWVEIFNPTAAPVDLAGFVLYDNNNTHALPIALSNTNTGGTTVPSLGYLVVYRDGDADFELNNSGGDSVRLFSGPIGSGGVLVDSHTYVRDGAENKSFARVPDGSTNWVDPDSTPGAPNSLFFEILPGESDPFEEPSKPPMVIPEIKEPDADAAPVADEGAAFAPDGGGIYLTGPAASSSEDSSSTLPVMIDLSATSTDPVASSTEPDATSTVSLPDLTTTATTTDPVLGDTSSSEPSPVSTPPIDSSVNQDGAVLPEQNTTAPLVDDAGGNPSGADPNTTPTTTQ